MFKSFHETFVYCSFALVIGLLYPNRFNVKLRLMIFVALTTINGPMLVWFGTYTVECFLKLDLFNTSRNITLAGLIGLYLMKTVYTIYNTNKFSILLDKVTEDLLKANYMKECCQEIYRKYIKIGKRGEICWIFIPILLTSQFTIYAAICNIYKSLIGSIEAKSMVHDLELKYLENKQDDTPVFELFYVYNTMQSIIIAFTFVGFDGSFCIVTTHLCLKLKLIGHNTHVYFKTSKTTEELNANLHKVIKEHQQAINFYNDVQNVYGGWLIAVFLSTSLMLSLNLYLINTLRQFHPKYVVFSISCVIHIFTPCLYSSQLRKISEDLVKELYDVDWEIWTNPTIRKLLSFMIANAQKPMALNGCGIVTFDMALFISVIQTSYSFFTLISSR